jgi:hypothetical protein
MSSILGCKAPSKAFQLPGRDINDDAIHLPDAKSGAKAVHLCSPGDRDAARHPQAGRHPSTAGGRTPKSAADCIAEMARLLL